MDFSNAEQQLPIALSIIFSGFEPAEKESLASILADSFNVATGGYTKEINLDLPEKCIKEMTAGCKEQIRIGLVEHDFRARAAISLTSYLKDDFLMRRANEQFSPASPVDYIDYCDGLRASVVSNS